MIGLTLSAGYLKKRGCGQRANKRLSLCFFAICLLAKMLFFVSAKTLLANHRLVFPAELSGLKRRRKSGFGHQLKGKTQSDKSPFRKVNAESLVEGNLLTDFSSGVHLADALGPLICRSPNVTAV